MLESLSTTVFTSLMVAVLAAALIIGWVTDEVLEHRAFGIIMNSVFVAGGILLGLYVFDHLILTHRIPVLYQNVYGWLTAAMIGATVTLLFFCGLRVAVGR